MHDQPLESGDNVQVVEALVPFVLPARDRKRLGQQEAAAICVIADAKRNARGKAGCGRGKSVGKQQRKIEFSAAQLTNGGKEPGFRYQNVVDEISLRE